MCTRILPLFNHAMINDKPSHDISNHIKSIQKLPHHVGKIKKWIIDDVIIPTYDEKEAKNFTEHRRSLSLKSKSLIPTLLLPGMGSQKKAIKILNNNMTQFSRKSWKIFCLVFILLQELPIHDYESLLHAENF